MAATLEDLLVAIKKLEGINLYTVPDEILFEYVLTVLGAAARQLIHLGHPQTWWRGHKLKDADAYHSSKQWLLYNPKPAAFNRASGPGHPMMYACRNWGTIASELDLKTGDVVQIIACRVKPGLTLKSDIIGELEAVANSGLSLIGYQESIETVEQMIAGDKREWHRAALADSFCAELFSKRIPKGKPELYKPTATIGFCMFGGSKGAVEALMYPSVQRRGGLNIAVPGAVVDAKFEVLISYVVRIRHLGYGLFDGDVLKMSERIDGDTIVWAPPGAVLPKAIPSGYTWSLAGGLKGPVPKA